MKKNKKLDVFNHHANSLLIETNKYQLNSKLLFSIIIPYYDTYETIKETLDSIVNQVFDLKKVEVIIVSDGAKISIDNLIKQYQNKFGHFKLIKKENGNWGSVINFVKENKMIHGDYFTILDSDDKFAPQCLSTFAKFINERNKKVDVLTSQFYFWQAKINKKQKRKIYCLSKSHFFSVINENYFKTAYSFPLCKFYRTYLFYESNFKLVENCSFQDVCLYYEMKKNCHSWQFINEYLGFYRCDRDNSSSNEQWSYKKLQWWKQTIEYLSNQDSGCIARFYFLANHFTKHYKKFIKQQKDPDKWKVVLKKKYDTSYVPRKYKLLIKIFCFFVVIFNKKIIKLI